MATQQEPTPKDTKATKQPTEAKEPAKKGAKKGGKTANPNPTTGQPNAEEAPQTIVATMGPPNVSNDDNVFAVCHIMATKNDTFIHVTDLTGRETLARVTGGMKVKVDRDEATPYAAMMAAVDIVNKLKELKINAVHIRLRGKGGHSSKSLGPGAQPALRTLARFGLKMGRIEDVTPTPTDTTRRKCGRKGRRL